MPKPNTKRQTFREEAERAINRELERRQIAQEDVDVAREEWELSAYEDFFADCRKAGHSTSQCGAIWQELKAAGDAPTDTGGSDDVDDDDALEAAMPALPVPETLDDLEDLARDADQLHMLVTTGCPSCNAAKEELSDWIDQGMVKVQNVQESDEAADIVLETGLEALPALVIEDDGEYTTV